MKIALIGRGTASSVSLASMMLYANKVYNMEDEIQFYCIYDPNIPIAHVGESISTGVVDVLERCIDFSFDQLSEFDGTVRSHTRYFWNDVNGKEFDVLYTKPGVHANSEKFSLFILKELQKKYTNIFEIQDEVLSLHQTSYDVTLKCKNEEYKFDYVLDCRGMPTAEELNSDAYAEPEFQGVNSVVIYPEFVSYEEKFTSTHVHENGWMFGVPIAHRKAWGYLYNNNYIDVDTAVEKLGEIKDIVDKKIIKLSWKQHYKVNAMDGRVLAIGNKLYFFEPHQAIPLHYYVNIASLFITELIEPVSSNISRYMNGYHTNQIAMIKDLIALNYVADTNMKSVYWKNTQAEAEAYLKNSKTFVDFAKVSIKSNIIQPYWSHGIKMMRNYIEGYNIDLKKFIP